MKTNKYINQITVKRYKNHYFRNDNKLRNLNDIDFCAFIWQLKTDRFSITGFSSKGFLYYLLAKTQSCIDIINQILPHKNKIINLLIK